MTINRNQVKKSGYVYAAIQASSDEHALIIFIVERYITFPVQVLDTIGIENLLRCHEYYLDFHYNKYFQSSKNK